MEQNLAASGIGILIVDIKISSGILGPTSSQLQTKFLKIAGWHKPITLTNIDWSPRISKEHVLVNFMWKCFWYTLITRWQQHPFFSNKVHKPISYLPTYLANSMELLVSAKLAHNKFHGIPLNSMELLVSAKLVPLKFHGIPWNCSRHRNWRTPSSMEFHGIPRTARNQNWETLSSK